MISCATSSAATNSASSCSPWRRSRAACVSGDTAPGAPVAARASLRQALSRMLAEGRDRLAVIDAEGRPLGAIHLADLLRR